MKKLDVIILAGGYASRLKPLSEYIPKPLLHVGGVPILNYILQKVIEINPARIVISTNKKFEDNFRYWLKTLENYSNLDERIELVVEETKREEEKLGAVGGLYYAIIDALVENDLLVVAGDNLFDFNLRKLVRKMRETGSFSIALYDIKDLELAKRYGVVLLENDKIIKFVEKPEKPESTLISTAIYTIPYKKLHLIEEYVKNPNTEKDRIGKFIEWLLYYKREPIYGVVYEGLWFDIGDLDSYIAANEFVKKVGWNRRWLWP